jgi:hypothetical protein
MSLISHKLLLLVTPLMVSPPLLSQNNPPNVNNPAKRKELIDEIMDMNLLSTYDLWMIN